MNLSRIRFCLSILLILFSSQLFAAKNPISWTLAGTFQNPVFSQASYSVTYTFTNQLPETLVKPLVIEKVASPANEFTYVDNCSGKLLTPHQSCTVKITLVPINAGQKSVQLIIAGYSKDRVPVPALTTSVPGSGSRVNVTGFVKQTLPSSLSVGTSANYNFTFTNNSPGIASDVSIQATDSGFQTSCGSKLAAGSSCSVSGTYTPVSISPSIQTVSATFNYSDGSPVTVSTSTAVPQATGIVGFFVSPNYLPAAMTPGSRSIEMKFQNYGPTAVGTITSNPATMVVVTGGDGTGTFSFTGGTPPTAQNNCTGVLPVGGACIVTGTFTAANTSATPYVVTGTLTYTGVTGSPTVLTTSTTVVSSLPTSRTVTFVNNCTFPVYFSLSGGQETGLSCSKSTGLGCPTGTSCDKTNGNCYWTNYAPIDNNFKLDAHGGSHTTDTVTIPATTIDPAIQWSGTMSASLACTAGTACGQADCGNSAGLSSVGACSPGIGFSPPVTQAEITMNLNTSDSYDVEVINGFTVPVSMVPGPYVTPSNYVCGWPGYSNASSVPAGFGACNWTSQATVPSNAYYWVTSNAQTGGESCNPLAPPTCGTTGQVCGLDGNLNGVCGNFLGFWSADEACGKNATAANPYFQCNTPVTGQFYPAGATLSDLMLCKVPKGSTSPTFNSCYQSYPGDSATQINTCCGCVDWWTDGVSGVNSTATSCVQALTGMLQANPIWLDTSSSGIISKIKWLKTACPSDYTYTFDDATSGFSCSNNLPGSPNSVGYTVTFCPATGASTFDTGLPAAFGTGDGRASF